jgi:hypothetical protein
MAGEVRDHISLYDDSLKPHARPRRLDFSPLGPAILSFDLTSATLD